MPGYFSVMMDEEPAATPSQVSNKAKKDQWNIHLVLDHLVAIMSERNLSIIYITSRDHEISHRQNKYNCYGLHFFRTYVISIAKKMYFVHVHPIIIFKIVNRSVVFTLCCKPFAKYWNFNIFRRKVIIMFMYVCSPASLPAQS